MSARRDWIAMHLYISEMASAQAEAPRKDAQLPRRAAFLTAADTGVTS